MDEAGKEVKMSQAERERKSVGLTPDEVRELNTPKPKKDMTRRDLVKKAANVLAAGFTAAAGTGLAATAQEALNSAPAPIIQEQKPDPKRDIPPAGVVFPATGVIFPENIRADAPVVEAPPPDAPVEPVYTYIVFGPSQFKYTPRPETKDETKDDVPLWPDKFGEFAPYNLEIVNKGTKAGIIIDKQELYDNLLVRLREWGNAPEVPRRIVIYEDIAQLNRESQLSYNQFFFSPETDVFGPMAYRQGRSPDGSLQLDVSVPAIKDPSRLEELSLLAGFRMLSRAILNFLFTDKDGNYRRMDRFNLSYSRINPLPIDERDENNNLVAGPLLAKYRNP